MTPELLQAGTEVIKTGGSLTGTFVLDGAILIAILKVVEAGISKWRSRSNGYNGKKNISAGQGDICREHGEEIARTVEFKIMAKDSLDRIEGKVDRLLERK